MREIIVTFVYRGGKLMCQRREHAGKGRNCVSIETLFKMRKRQGRANKL